MGYGFQKWKGFQKKKMDKLTTQALPNKTNTIPKITYTKHHTKSEISILIKTKQK